MKYRFLAFLSLLITSIFLTSGGHFSTSNKSAGLNENKEYPGWFAQFKIMKENDEGKIPRGLYQKWQISESRFKKNNQILDSVKELGPFNVGGRTRAILIDQLDSLHLIAGSVSGGIWQSYDGGKTWAAHDDGAPNLNVTSLAQDPLNPDYIYFGTGEPSGNLDAMPGNGVFFSSDRGGNFQPLQATQNDSFKYIWDIATSPVHPGWVYVATRNNGLFLSKDLGQSFENIFSETSSVNDIEVFPSGTVMIAVDGQGIFKSYNGLDHFNKINTSIPSSSFSRVELAYCRDSSNYVYSIFANPSKDGVLGLYRSTDTGATWKKVTNPSDEGIKYPFTWYALTIHVNPTNPKMLISGCANLGFSLNGGTTWSKTSNSHADYHVAVNYNNSHYLLLGNDGGIYRCSWDSLDQGYEDLNQGYNVTQYYAGSFFPTGDNAFGGTQDNGTQARYNGKKNFYHIMGGDGAYTAIAQKFPSIAFASFQNGKIRRTLNALDTEPDFKNAYADLDVNNDNNIDDGVWFINPFEMNPIEDGQIFYVTLKRIWRTQDAAETWEPITNYISIFSYNHIEQPYSLGLSNSKNPIVYVGGRDALFYRINSAGTAKSGDEINLRGTVPVELLSDFISCLQVHPYDSSIVFASFSDYENKPRVWKVTNATTDNPIWTSISGNLPPELPVNWLVLDPVNPDSVIIAATDFGLYITKNGGTSWYKDDRIPNVAIEQIKLRPTDRKLFIFTHGRGLWTANLEKSIVGIKKRKNVAQYSEFNIFPNPAKDYLIIQSSGKTIIDIYDDSGRKISSIPGDSGPQRITTSSFEKGLYFVVKSNGKTRTVKKLVIQ